jgi:solute carrier family 7 (L-type amino acid transporter), member 9/15
MFIFAGLIFYIPFVHVGVHFDFMGKNYTKDWSNCKVLKLSFIPDKVTLFFQLLFEVVPTTSISGIGNMYD